MALSFSVIIPTYARPKQLVACLAALSGLDYPRDEFEVIVVDDGSRVPPEAVIAPYCDGLDITLLTQPNAGPAAARNTGALRARGQFLAFTDDDCTPAADWLRALAVRFAATPDHLIGGQTQNALPANLCSTTSQIVVDGVYDFYNTNGSRAHFFASNNLACSAAQFRILDGFDAAFRTSEDRDFCDRWLRQSYPMTYAPEAVVYHAHAMTLAAFWRQHFGYGRGAFRFHQARAERGSGGMQPDPEFYRTIFSRPFSQARGVQALLLTGMLMVWQAANAAGFCWEGARWKAQVKD